MLDYNLLNLTHNLLLGCEEVSNSRDKVVQDIDTLLNENFNLSEDTAEIETKIDTTSEESTTPYSTTDAVSSGYDAYRDYLDSLAKTPRGGK